MVRHAQFKRVFATGPRWQAIYACAIGGEPVRITMPFSGPHTLRAATAKGHWVANGASGAIDYFAANPLEEQVVLEEVKRGEGWARRRAPTARRRTPTE